MDPYGSVGECHDGHSLFVTLLSLLSALAGLAVAAAADDTLLLVAGLVLGSLGPVLAKLLTRRPN